LVHALNVEAASVWDVQQHGLSLRYWHGERPPAPFRLDHEQDFDGDVLLLHQVAKQARGTLPLMLGRFRAGVKGPVIGYLGIDALPLARSAEAARLFALVVEWMSIAAGQAQAYQHLARERQRLQALP
jgi:hypothetical protein